MIELENIYKVFSTDEIKTFALNGVSLNVRKGDFMSIMGTSGCGKSTLLNIIKRYCLFWFPVAFRHISLR